ncbi:hypothetical protein JCM19055_2278 [Geomicrobium sp. JCM 19055]|nr:hypothetical protein JCM19055_2278 [Geomicrobium sp. JCM 19055]
MTKAIRLMRLRKSTSQNQVMQGMYEFIEETGRNTLTLDDLTRVQPLSGLRLQQTIKRLQKKETVYNPQPKRINSQIKA